MGIFSSLLSGQDPNQSGTLSPQTQGLMALSQALFRAGQPSRIPVNTMAAIGGAYNDALPIYTAAQSRMNMANSLQKGDLNATIDAMLRSPDPQMQNLGLSSKMNMLTPQYQINMAVMKQMLDGMNNGQGGANGGNSSNPGVSSYIQQGAVTGSSMSDLAMYANDPKGYFEALAKAKLPTDLQKNVSSSTTQPYVAKDTLVNTAGGYVPATALTGSGGGQQGQSSSQVNIPPIPAAPDTSTIVPAAQGQIPPIPPAQSVQQMNDPAYQEGRKTTATKDAENVATSKDALDTILGRLPSIFDKTQQMRTLAPQTGSGLYGRANVIMSGNNPFGQGIAQGNQHTFETLNNQLFVNELPGLAKGMGRLDLPIINAAKNASQVNEWDKPHSKIQMLDTLENSLLGGLQASINKYETESGKKYTVPANTPNAAQLQDLVDKARNYNAKNVNQATQSQQSRTAGIPLNAKMGNDGNYYVPDPSRPGKYLQVVTGQ